MPIDPVTAVGIGSAIGLSPTAGRLVEKILGPTASEAGELLRAYVKPRLYRMFEKSGSGLHQAAIEPGPIPLKVLVPILEKAGLEEDEHIQDLWAALLANAAAGKDGAPVTALFVEYLSTMTGTEVQLMDMVYQAHLKSVQAEGTTVGSLSFESIEDVYSAQDSLVARGLLRRSGPLEMTESGAQRTYSFVEEGGITITALGMRFMDACTMPEKNA